MGYQNQRILIELIARLREHESWAGRTHVQKAAYLVSALAGVALPFTFVLYKHGPYSFDLDAELNDMLSYGAIEEESPDPKYGPKLKRGAANAEWLIDKEHPGPVIEQAIERVAQLIRDSDTRTLEKLATAAWIVTEEHMDQTEQVAQRLNELKPHVTMLDAETAVRDFRKLHADFAAAHN